MRKTESRSADLAVTAICDSGTITAGEPHKVSRFFMRGASIVSSLHGGWCHPSPSHPLCWQHEKTRVPMVAGAVLTGDLHPTPRREHVMPDDARSVSIRQLRRNWDFMIHATR